MEKLGVGRIAFCRAPALSRARWRRVSVVPFALAAGSVGSALDAVSDISLSVASSAQSNANRASPEAIVHGAGSCVGGLCASALKPVKGRCGRPWTLVAEGARCSGLRPDSAVQALVFLLQLLGRFLEVRIDHDAIGRADER